MASTTNSKNARVSVTRNSRLLGEFHPSEIGSLLETGFFREDDVCKDPETSAAIPLRKFLEKGTSAGFSRTHENEYLSGVRRRARPTKFGDGIAWMITAFALALGTGAGFWGWKTSEDLRESLATSEAANAELKQQYQNLLFAAREVAADNLVRGRIIIRDGSHKRIALPGVKVRLFTRQALETYLAERYARIDEAGGTDPARLANHFLKDLPTPIATSTSDSDGRYELPVPGPGEYVIQTSLRSAQNGEMRIWFVTFDSHDPLNTPVDITESNVVEQFNPLFMIVEGR